MSRALRSLIITLAAANGYAQSDVLLRAIRNGDLPALRAQFAQGADKNARDRRGSWYVRSRAPKIQPYFQSGFPFEHDQWISSAATAWAVMALAPSLEKEKLASR